VAGALLTGIFATKLVNPAGNDGLFAGNPGQLVVQLYAVVAAVLIAGVGTIVVLGIVRAVFGTRARISDEMIGLDLSEHGEEAYFGGEAGLGGSALAQSVIVSTHDGEEHRKG
jgi:Amt family ammonium transporter